MRVDFFEQKFTKTKKSESESEDFHLCFYETGVIGDASGPPVWALSIESWHWRRRWRGAFGVYGVVLAGALLRNNFTLNTASPPLPH